VNVALFQVAPPSAVENTPLPMVATTAMFGSSGDGATATPSHAPNVSACVVVTRTPMASNESERGWPATCALHATTVWNAATMSRPLASIARSFTVAPW
jgi:hypothetical protein